MDLLVFVVAIYYVVGLKWNVMWLAWIQKFELLMAFFGFKAKERPIKTEQIVLDSIRKE